MSTGISVILCHQGFHFNRNIRYYITSNIRNKYVNRNIRNIISSGISRILCHQEYQEYYVIRNIKNTMSSVTLGTSMSPGI